MLPKRAIRGWVDSTRRYTHVSAHQLRRAVKRLRIVQADHAASWSPDQGARGPRVEAPSFCQRSGVDDVKSNLVEHELDEAQASCAGEPTAAFGATRTDDDA